MKKYSILIAVFAAWLTTSLHAADEPKVPRPQIPRRTFDITQFGAVADGTRLNTDAVANTIKAASEHGGGVVVVPKGTFLCGKIVLADKIELRLESGATLLMTDAPDVYRNGRGGFDDLISATGCSDVAVTGSGTIDGQGQRWWDEFRKIKGTPQQDLPENHRPYLIELRNCTRVLFDGVTIQNSPSFHLVPHSCQDVTIRNVTFKAPADAPNTDALDPSGWNYLITGCTFDVGDDCIAVKASGASTPQRLSCEDFYVSDCKFLHGHGLSVGGQTPGGLRRMTVRNCTFEGTEAGIRMKAARGSGGLVEDLTYEDITMKKVKVPVLITSYYPKAPKDPARDAEQPVTPKTPIWRNITIRRVKVTDSPEAGRIIGLPEMPAGPIAFSDVHIEASKPFTVTWGRDISFKSSQIVTPKPPAFVAEKSGINGIDLRTGK